MLREKSLTINRLHKILDICLTIMAFIGAYVTKKYLFPKPFLGLTTAPNYYVVLLAVIIIWYVTMDLFGLYGSLRIRRIGEICWTTVKAVTAAMMIMAFFMYFFKLQDVSRIMLGLFYLMDILLLVTSKVIIFTSLKHYRAKGYNFKNVLIVGSWKGAEDVIDAIGDQLDAGFKVIGCLETEKTQVGKPVKKGISVVGCIQDLEVFLRNQVVDELIFSMPLKDIKDADIYISLAEEFGVSTRILPQWWIRKYGYNPKIGTFRIENFLGIPTMTLSTTPRQQGALFIKNTIDYLLAAVIVIILLPVFALVAVSIKLVSPGPIFYQQTRVGQNGRRFQFYKFRTMVPGADQYRDALEPAKETNGPVFKIRKDPRIIPYIGAFMRKAGLDELPQLVNVLKGEMILVGPRPPIPSEVEQYDVWHRRRLSMKPGMTCLWQTTPRRNSVDFTEWMKMDLAYIDNWSLWLDVKILIKTIGTVFRAEGM